MIDPDETRNADELCYAITQQFPARTKWRYESVSPQKDSTSISITVGSKKYLVTVKDYPYSR